MAIDFPAAPVLNEIFTSGGKSWVYDGGKWVVLPASFTDVESISTPNFIAFDTTPTGAPGTPGTILWNEADGTFDMVLPHSTLQVGMEMYLPPVLNNSGVTIPDGAFVMATGAQGDRITVAKAVTDGSVDPMYMVGIATADILNGADDGTITTNGIVRDLDTSAWVIGTVLYPDPLVPGGLTSTKPDAPAIRTPIAIVLRSHATTGRILVRMTTGSVLGGTDSNVKFTSLATNDVIKWNGSLWINAPESGGSGGSSVTVSETAPVAPSTGDLWYASGTGSTYIWFDSYWVEVGATAGAGSVVTLSDTAPATPVNGDIWVDTNAGVTFDLDTIDGGLVSDVFDSALDGGVA